MIQVKLFLIAIIGLWSFCDIATGGKVVNCYYGTWSNYRPGNGKFVPSNVDPSLCTHLGYAFFGIKDSGALRSLDDWLDSDSGLGHISKTIALKQKNPKLKVLAVVGGWNEGSENYSKMAADANKRKTFISSTLNFIRQHGFDGLDLDWEYPAQRGGSPQDKTNFVILLKELKAAFEPYNLELSIAVGASENTARISYDIPNIAKYLDYINVMTYDFAMASDGVLGFNAPLKGQGQNNVQSAINYWLQNGAPANKLVVGLASYGRTFQLSNSQQTAVGSPSSGPGSPGPFTREAGYMGYNEICALSGSWSHKWADAYGVPYVHNENQWIGYDNVRSIELKMDFINSLNLAGAMVWSIETDDFLGTCGEKYPLLKAINRKLNNQQGGVENTTEKPKTTKTTKSTVTTKAPTIPGDNNCSTNGIFGNAQDCTRFYQCSNGIRYDLQCSPGLNFDVVSSSCNWPQMAVCRN